MTRGLITLSFKQEEKCELGNWMSIALLNTTYKIYAQALQRGLQPMLVEIISTDQTTFLPLGYIVDNGLLTHEYLTWEKQITMR